MGEVGLELSSVTTFCDENDGPNAVSNASAEGNDDKLVLLRGERGSLLSDRGLFVIDKAGMNPETWDDAVDPPPLIPTLEVVVSCHSLV